MRIIFCLLRPNEILISPHSNIKVRMMTVSTRFNSPFKRRKFTVHQIICLNLSWSLIPEKGKQKTSLSSRYSLINIMESSLVWIRACDPFFVPTEATRSKKGNSLSGINDDNDLVPLTKSTLPSYLHMNSIHNTQSTIHQFHSLILNSTCPKQKARGCRVENKCPLNLFNNSNYFN